ERGQDAREEACASWRDCGRNTGHRSRRGAPAAPGRTPSARRGIVASPFGDMVAERMAAARRALARYEEYRHAALARGDERRVACVPPGWCRSARSCAPSIAPPPPPTAPAARVPPGTARGRVASR